MPLEKVAKCTRDEACRRVRAEGVDVDRDEVVEERVNAKVLEKINEERCAEVAQGVVLTVDLGAGLAADSALEAVLREIRVQYSASESGWPGGMARSKLVLPGAIFHPVVLVWSALRSGAPKTPDFSALGPTIFLRRQLRLHESPSEFGGQPHNPLRLRTRLRAHVSLERGVVVGEKREALGEKDCVLGHRRILLSAGWIDTRHYVDKYGCTL